MTDRDTLDTLAVLGAMGAFMDWLPTVAAFLAAIWTAIRIYEWARVRIFKIEKINNMESFK